jgi:hypothetical protein
MNQPGKDRSTGGSQGDIGKGNNEATGTDRDQSGRQSDEMQGEGNYDAAREYNAEQQEFVASGKVPAAARAAAPKSEAERAEMLEAERRGKERAKE